MAAPIVFISHNRVKPGHLEPLRELLKTATSELEREKPRTLVFGAYAGDDGTRIDFVHVFADAEAMDLHVEGAQERSARAYEHIEPGGFDIYGSPSDAVLEGLRRSAAAAGVPLLVYGDAAAAFIRLPAN